MINDINQKVKQSKRPKFKDEDVIDAKFKVVKDDE
jgi:hypothetical protein